MTTPELPDHRRGVRAFLIGFGVAVVLALLLALVLHLLGVDTFAIGITIALVFGFGGALVGAWLSAREGRRR